MASLLPHRFCLHSIAHGHLRFHLPPSPLGLYSRSRYVIIIAPTPSETASLQYRSNAPPSQYKRPTLALAMHFLSTFEYTSDLDRLMTYAGLLDSHAGGRNILEAVQLRKRFCRYHKFSSSGYPRHSWPMRSILPVAAFSSATNMYITLLTLLLHFCEHCITELLHERIIAFLLLFSKSS